jgi:MFS family permease
MIPPINMSHWVAKLSLFSPQTGRWFIERRGIRMSKISRLARREIEYECELDSTKQSHLRRLWIASVISGTCVAAHDNAATSLMNTFAGSPFLISLMSTVASLPFFLFTLPVGVLADRVNRKKLTCAINVWLAAIAVALAILGWLHLLNPYLMLISVLLLGGGFALNAPTWTSIVPQIVSTRELGSAATLGGLQFNISGIIGPALGGLLVTLVGANFVFLANGACFLLASLSILQWKQPEAISQVSSESFSQSFRAIIRYVRCTSELQTMLARNFLFALFISAIPAVVPVIGLKVLDLNSGKLGLLFTSMGVGSVVGALFIAPWFRARLSSKALTLWANLLVILAYLLMGIVRQTELFLLVAALVGAGWTLSASELWASAQRAIPDRLRGRMNATIIMVSQGAMVIGGVIWGSLVAVAGPGSTLLGAALLFFVSLVLDRLSVNLASNIRKRASDGPYMNVKSQAAAQAALTTGLLAV